MPRLRRKPLPHCLLQTGGMRIVVVSLMFQGFLSIMLHGVFYQTPWINIVIYYYSGFMDSTFLSICAVPRIADP